MNCSLSSFCFCSSQIWRTEIDSSCINILNILKHKQWSKHIWDRSERLLRAALRITSRCLHAGSGHAFVWSLTGSAVIWLAASPKQGSDPLTSNFPHRIKKKNNNNPLPASYTSTSPPFLQNTHPLAQVICRALNGTCPGPGFLKNTWSCWGYCSRRDHLVIN